MGVIGRGDDRTFVLDEQTWVKYPDPVVAAGYPGSHSFYLFRLSSAGRVSSLSRLRVTVPATQVLGAFALSPDGQRLALAVASRKGPARTDLEVVTLSTGSTRVWAANGIFRSGAADSRGLSWTADGRELAFEWQANNVGMGPDVEARLLNLTSAGGDLLAASRRVIATTRQFTPSGSTFQVADAENEPVVTPDGSAIVCANAVYFTKIKTKESGPGHEQPVPASPEFSTSDRDSSSGSSGTGPDQAGRIPLVIAGAVVRCPSGRVLIGVDPAGGRAGSG